MLRSDRVTLRFHGVCRGFEPGEPRVQIGDSPALGAQRVQLPAEVRREIVGARTHHGLSEDLVSSLIELGQSGDERERLLVGALEAVQSRGDVFEAVLHEGNVVLGAPVGALLLVDLHAVQTRGSASMDFNTETS